jgi:hypothetical protein
MYIKNYAFLMWMRYDGAALAPSWCVPKARIRIWGEAKRNGNPALDVPEKV